MTLTSEQLLELIQLGIKSYYDDLIRVTYPYATLINTILGVEGDLGSLKIQLAAWYSEKTELLSLVEAADLKGIYESYSKEADDSDMIAKFTSSISFSTEGQKLAFLSAINSIHS